MVASNGPERQGDIASVYSNPDRGEVIYYVCGNGIKFLERFRVRTPAFANIHAMVKVLQGCQIADVPNIILTIDPCITCGACVEVCPVKCLRCRTITQYQFSGLMMEYIIINSLIGKKICLKLGINSKLFAIFIFFCV